MIGPNVDGTVAKGRNSWTDDGVRQHHGVTCRRGDCDAADDIRLTEGEEYIHLRAHAFGSKLTVWQARYLAAKLYHLSRRIRQRKESAE